MHNVYGRWNRIITIFGIVLLWLCFTSIFIPSRKKWSVPSQAIVEAEEYSEEVDMVTNIMVTENLQKSLVSVSTKLPPVMFVTSKEREEFFATSTTTIQTTAVARSSIEEDDIDNSDAATEDNVSSLPKNETNGTIIESSSMLQKIEADSFPSLATTQSPISSSWNEQQQQQQQMNTESMPMTNETLETNLTNITRLDGGNILDLPTDNFRDSTNSNSSDTTTSNGNIRDEEYYYNDYGNNNMPREPQEPLDLSEYKKVYPRYKNPIPDEYLKTMTK